MHTISIFVDQNRMPKLASYFECQTHLAKNLRNSANFIIRNLRTGLKKDPVDRTSNENEVYVSALRWQMKSFRKMLTDSRSSCRVCLQATRPAQRSKSASTTNRKTIRSCQRPITGCSPTRHWMR